MRLITHISFKSPPVILLLSPIHTLISSLPCPSSGTRSSEAHVSRLNIRGQHGLPHFKASCKCAQDTAIFFQDLGQAVFPLTPLTGVVV